MMQISFDDLLNEEKETDTPPPSPLYKEILGLLESQKTSTLEICECLINIGMISNERYSSNKPKQYPLVCSILEDMKQQGKVILVNENGKNDRFYQLKNSK